MPAIFTAILWVKSWECLRRWYCLNTLCWLVSDQADILSGRRLFDLPNPNLYSGWIQWNRPFSARIRVGIRESSESSFDADSLAKPEVNDVTHTSPTKRTAMTSYWTSPTNPDHSICQWIRIQIHYESESRFGQIEYALKVNRFS